MKENGYLYQVQSTLQPLKIANLTLNIISQVNHIQSRIKLAGWGLNASTRVPTISESFQ